MSLPGMFVRREGCWQVVDGAMPTGVSPFLPQRGVEAAASLSAWGSMASAVWGKAKTTRRQEPAGSLTRCLVWGRVGSEWVCSRACRLPSRGLWRAGGKGQRRASQQRGSQTLVSTFSHLEGRGCWGDVVGPRPAGKSGAQGSRWPVSEDQVHRVARCEDGEASF